MNAIDFDYFDANGNKMKEISDCVQINKNVYILKLTASWYCQNFLRLLIKTK